MFLLLPLWLSCQGSETPSSADLDGSTLAQDSAPLGGAAGGDSERGGLDTQVDEIPDMDLPVPDPSDFFFSETEVILLSLQLEASSMDSLRADPYTYVPAQLTVQGEAPLEVAVRVKGRLGSLRSIDAKPALKVDVDYYVDGQELHGLRRMNLNNMVQDCSMVHDFTAYALYREMGVQAPRVGYVWLRLNGMDYGLYANVEAFDEKFLERRFEDPDGNLYDGDYYLYSDNSYQLVDFEEHAQDFFQLDEGEEVGLEDIRAVTESLDRSAGTDSLWEDLGQRVQLEKHAVYWAVEVWVGQYDGYTYNKNNYRVYFDPSSGLAELLPWDHDWAFYASTPVTSPSGRLSQTCKSDARCHELFTLALEDIEAEVQAMNLDLRMGVVADMIRPFVAADPRREQSAESIYACQDATSTWIAERSATLAAMSGL